MNLMSGTSSLLAMGLLSPVQSMLWLMMLFVSTAMSLYNQDFMLMGMLYMLMYVGAIAMTFLFMLSLLKMDYMPQGNVSPLMMTLLCVCFMPLDLTYDYNGMMMEFNDTYNELTVVGNQFYTEYAMLLMMTGMMLMLSVVGAMAITR
uniref:NADH-ubiquinone oxidoreductase chain 6 n=7 Tax=Metschnikowia TaxID=27320 RepID=A0A7D7PSR6_9ASCO|nr:Nad6 [Metschnikowia lochheadii]YP_009922224.1 Nad6 [Metschnikowia santaceciliae]YP_009922266.1 Nad6 [Metschnikowia matae]QMQ98493.1 Nad6 [Metschnikowia sp. 00-154.1]QMQ98558.1 Nad6 [Metschnikowia continentalis]QMS50869.1 Nad6 [[Candida] ipomoeae]QMS50952.1 Nad6 [Metschnikowia sp. 01-655c1]QMS50695.1 Nad6 [Metschnikowia lochheadii]